MSGEAVGRRVGVVIVALFLLVAGLVVPAAPAVAYDEGTIVQLANEARWSNGQAGLLSNADLDAVALAWAQHMASTGAMEHNPDVASQVPSGWRSVGENVAMGYSSGGSVHEGWMNSPGHRANILGDYTDIGVALVDGGGSSWAVQVFARYEGHVGPSAPAPEAPAESEPAPPPQPEPAPPVETPTPTPVPTPTPTPTPTATRTATPIPTPVADDSAAAAAGPLPLGLLIAGAAVLLAVAAAVLWWLLHGRPALRFRWKPRARRRSLDG